MLKNLAFYAIAGSVVAWIAQALGASFGVTLLLSLVAPPTLLLGYMIVRYNRIG